jgi:uncharacterized protein YkwD
MWRQNNYARATNAALFIFLLVVGSPHHAEARLARNSQEREIARLVAAHPLQGRPRLVHDAHLHLVARAKARDMARRNYFGHVDPDRIGPNHVVRMTGFRLPSYYASNRRANNVESLAAGTNHTPAKAFQAWLKSSGHRRHLLASEAFYQEQTRFGVGYAKSPGSRFKNYYVFFSAPPSTPRLTPPSKQMRNLFLKNTPRQIERLRRHKR